MALNLLVTNTRYTQAYDIIRSLRPFANHIVAEGYGRNLMTARSTHAVNSRLVDRWCRLPSPVEDWKAGIIRESNTEREEAYVQGVLAVCARERINTIYPSWDPHVYVFSKNRERFAEKGILIPVPGLSRLMVLLDKLRSVRAAQEAGFPCPRTHVPGGPDDLKEIARDLGFPIVIKLRFTTGGWGLRYARDLEELSEQVVPMLERGAKFLLQEFIPGERRAVHFILDKEGQVKFAFVKKTLRNFRIRGQFGTFPRSIEPDSLVAEGARLLQRIGWWGAGGVEVLVDRRDGIPKLLEIHPRYPRSLWNRTGLGVNEPWMCLQIARNQPVEAVTFPSNVCFVSPAEDLGLTALQVLDRLAYLWRRQVRGRALLSADNAPPGFRELWRYRYLNFANKGKIVYDPYVRYFLEDPLVSLLWWIQFSTWLYGQRKDLGS